MSMMRVRLPSTASEGGEARGAVTGYSRTVRKAIPGAVDYVAALEIADGMLSYARGRLAKAATPKVLRDREALFADVVPTFADELSAYFDGLLERLLGTISKALAIDWDPDSLDWTYEDDLITGIVLRWYETLGPAAFGALAEQLGVELRWDLGDRPIAAVIDQVAVRVRGINEASRDALRAAVSRAIDSGYSIEQLVGGVAADGFPGIRGLVSSWASTPDGAAGARAHAIALTETATAYTLSSLAGYETSGLVDEVEIFDGPECGWTEHDDPDLADGSVRTLDEAWAYPTSHPNCQRAVGPVVAR